MGKEEVMGKIGDAVKTTKAFIQNGVSKGKEKLEEAGGFEGLKAKAKDALAEVKANFRSDENATGMQKVTSRFVNLWKSGTTGKSALISCSVASFLLLLAFVGICSIAGGGGAKQGGNSAAASSRSSSSSLSSSVAKEESPRIVVPEGMFAVDSLYIGMPASDAVQACWQIASQSGDLGVVDSRSADAKYKDPVYVELDQKAQKDVERFLQWQSWPEGCLYDPNAPGFKGEKANGVLVPKGCSSSGGVDDGMLNPHQTTKAVDMLSSQYQTEWKLLGDRNGKMEEIVFTNATDLSDAVEPFDVGKPKRKELFLERGLVDVGAPVWVRLVLKGSKGDDVKKKDIADFWLLLRAQTAKTYDDRYVKDPVIKIGTWVPEGYTYKLKELCYVWLDDDYKVKQVFYNEDGLARFFHARHVPADQFASDLVEGFREIPGLECNVKTEEYDEGEIRTCIWTYRDDEMGYEVKFFDRSFRLNNGQEVDFELYGRNPEIAVGLAFLAMVDKHPKRYFCFYSVKPKK